MSWLPSIGDFVSRMRSLSPPQPRRGGCADQKKPRSNLSPRRRSGVGQQPSIFLTNTTPAAPSKLPRRLCRQVSEKELARKHHSMQKVDVLREAQTENPLGAGCPNQSLVPADCDR